MTLRWQKTWGTWDENDFFAWKKATGSWIFQQVTDYSWDMHCLDEICNQPLHYLAKHTQNGENAIRTTIQTAIGLGAYVNAIGFNNSLPIHSASRFNQDPVVVSTLYDNGAFLNTKTLYEGNTPLHLAILFNPNPQVAEALIQRGADPKLTNYEGLTPLDAISNRTINASIKRRLLRRATHTSLFFNWFRKDKEKQHQD